MALFVYTAIASASAVGLIWRHPLAHLSAQAAAPIGACFTFLCLLTGSLWGKPMWGAWWVWDARLTSVLVLFFLYLGFMALNAAFDDPARGEKSAAVLALVGFVNVPVIKFSVDWWNTLHQPASVVKMSGPAIHGSMLIPLLTMAAGFTLYFFAVLLLRMRALMLARRVRALTMAGVQRAGGAVAGQAGGTS
jgi:heme exporter protein C